MNIVHVIGCYEKFKTVNGKFGFCCMEGIVEVNDELFLASWNRRSTIGINQDELINVNKLRTENRGPKILPSWKTIIPIADHYIKSPSLSEYANDKLEWHMKEEIEICEILRRHPHGNAGFYYGCCTENGRATGLCFKKYEKTLLETVNPQGLNKRAFILSGRSLVTDRILTELDSLLAGIQHLHSLGIVHNDISSASIMWHKTLVLIDFGSCRLVGEPLRETGTKRTHEWHNPSDDVALPENDLRAFAELKSWLSGSVDDLQW